ncbi:CRTAC1 family protein [Aureliella helgolandensis]|uniref:ASPIC and UnbV n=1 Tax=Aureliella helgolandensis TaxID=2527968 RepID=A0A518GGP2_9BACT|nr:CRTAC1 family protein [Aureliella helgolandensis]QDV27765.1 ASPIC and UnbV [Aureliella helgolandensis]
MNCGLCARRWLFLGGLLLLSGLSKVSAQPVWSGRLDVVPAVESGLDFLHTDGGSGRRYIVESVVGALALFDFDDDGWIDVYLVNGAALPGTELVEPPKNRLYRNNGDWTFTDVTESAGVGDVGYAMGVVASDYDQDGDTDLLVSNYGENVFYINQGDGTFVESTNAVGLACGMRFGAGNAFYDMEGDGDLDLYCASYVDFDFKHHRTRTIAGKVFHVGPNDFPAAKDYVFANNGDGTFSDVTQWAGVGDLRAPGMGVMAADFDRDGDCDVLVANDQRGNYLLANDGTGRLEEQGILWGLAFDRHGKANGNMGLDYADLDGDGELDVLTTTYQDEMPVYYQSLGEGFYSDATNVAQWSTELIAHVSWGIGAVDFDNDGDRDVMIACGHFLDNIEYIDDRTTMKVANYLLANDGRGRFVNVSGSAGSALAVVDSSRGAGFDDLDNDGAVDGVITNFNSHPTLMRNTSGGTHKHLSLELVGTHSNRDALGSFVELEDSLNRKQVQVVCAGRGYESSYGQRLYFGTGDADPRRVVVTWPTGVKESFLPQTPRLTIVEGCGTREP